MFSTAVPSMQNKGFDMLIGLAATSHCALHYGLKRLEQLQPVLWLQNARAVGGLKTRSVNFDFEPHFSCAAGKQ